jgi:hypothetical protein
LLPILLFCGLFLWSIPVCFVLCIHTHYHSMAVLPPRWRFLAEASWFHGNQAFDRKSGAAYKKSSPFRAWRGVCKTAFVLCSRWFFMFCFVGCAWRFSVVDYFIGAGLFSLVFCVFDTLVFCI